MIETDLHKGMNEDESPELERFLKSQGQGADAGPAPSLPHGGIEMLPDFS